MSRLATLIILISSLTISANGQGYFCRKYGNPSKYVRDVAKKETNSWLANCSDSAYVPHDVDIGKLKFDMDYDDWDLLKTLSGKKKKMTKTEIENACKQIESSTIYFCNISIETQKDFSWESITFYFNGMGNLKEVNVTLYCKSCIDPDSHWYKPDCAKETL